MIKLGYKASAEQFAPRPLLDFAVAAEARGFDSVVGTGGSMNEVPVLGIEWPDFKERFGRLKEVIEIMRKLWTEERVTYDGEYFHLRNATVYDRPERPIPLYGTHRRVSGHGFTHSCSMRRAPTSCGSSSCTAPRSCRGFASGSRSAKARRPPRAGARS